jgi:peptide/nickel transport system permease protein
VEPGFPAFVVRRAIGACGFVLLVSISAIVLARLAPGDATSDMALAGYTPEQIAARRQHLGLDRPVIAQLGEWAVGLVRFDLGQTSTGLAVNALVRDAAIETAKLASVALLLATAIGLPLGVLTGSRPRSWLSRAVTPLSMAMLACPPILGALALLLVAARTNWISAAPGDLALPAIALALPLAASLERLQSRATAEALHGPDLVAAAARGVPPRRLVWIHAFRQSLRPVLGVYGVLIGSLFSGSLAVEVITSWPGLGRLMFEALAGREIWLVAGGALAGAVLIAAGNFVADLARAAADPRVRLD